MNEQMKKTKKKQTRTRNNWRATKTAATWRKQRRSKRCIPSVCMFCTTNTISCVQRALGINWNRLHFVVYWNNSLLKCSEVCASLCISMLFFILFNFFGVISVHHCRIVDAANGFNTATECEWNDFKFFGMRKAFRRVPRGVRVNFIKFFVSLCDSLLPLGFVVFNQIELFVVCSLGKRMNSINVRICHGLATTKQQCHFAVIAFSICVIMIIVFGSLSVYSSGHLVSSLSLSRCLCNRIRGAHRSQTKERCVWISWACLSISTSLSIIGLIKVVALNTHRAVYIPSNRIVYTI